MDPSSAAYAYHGNKITPKVLDQMTAELAHGQDPETAFWAVYKTKDGTTKAGLFGKDQSPATQTGLQVFRTVTPPVDLGFMALSPDAVFKYNPAVSEAKQRIIVNVETMDKYPAYRKWYDSMCTLLGRKRYEFLLSEDGKQFLHSSLHNASVDELEQAAQSEFDKRIYACKPNVPDSKILQRNSARAANRNLKPVSDQTAEAIDLWSPGDPHGIKAFLTDADPQKALDLKLLPVTLPTGGDSMVGPADYSKLRHGAIGAYELSIFGIYFSTTRDQSSTVTRRGSHVWLLSNGPEQQSGAVVSNFLDAFAAPATDDGPKPPKRRRSDSTSEDEV